VRKTLTLLDLAVGLVLALGHIWFYFSVINADGGWGGVLVVLVDLPFSILLVRLMDVLSLNSPNILLISGTVWWFCLGILISMLVRRIPRLIRRLSGPVTRLGDWLVKVIEGDGRVA
jgi:hypothetical protein